MYACWNSLIEVIFKHYINDKTVLIGIKQKILICKKDIF